MTETEKQICERVLTAHSEEGRMDSSSSSSLDMRHVRKTPTKGSYSYQHVVTFIYTLYLHKTFRVVEQWRRLCLLMHEPPDNFHCPLNNLPMIHDFSETCSRRKSSSHGPNLFHDSSYQNFKWQEMDRKFNKKRPCFHGSTDKMERS